MDRFVSFIEKKVAPVANILTRQKYLQALQNIFSSLIPLFTIGSFALILISPPMDFATMDPGLLRSFFQGWQRMADTLAPSMNAVFNVTMGLLSLYVAIGLGYFLSKHYKLNSVIPMFITTGSFVIAATMSIEGVMDFTYFDGKGLFTSILVSLLSFEFYRFLVEKKIGRIDLSGNGVPPALVDSIGNLVPAALVLVSIAVLSNLLLVMTGSGIPEIMTMIMTPIVKGVDSIGGIVGLALLVMVFWWFGIHDIVITGPLSPFLINNFTANAAAFTAGTAAVSLPFIVTEPFWWTFMAIGGSGATFGLAILALLSKSKQIKTIGRLAIVPAFFNINEPLIFGLPLMYNPIMMIPFIFVMPLNALLTYLAMNAGLVGRTFANASWNMFCPIGALINTMDIKAVFLIIILIVIDTIIYLPFFKTYEKQKIREEMNENMEG